MEFTLTKRLTLSRAGLLFCLTSWLSLFLAAGNGMAETVSTEEWQIEADKITRFESPGSIVATGNVVITKLEQLPPELSKKQQHDLQWANLLEEKAPAPESATGDMVEGVAAPRYKTSVTIRADWITYDVENGSITARGNVNIKGADDELRADEGVVDLEKETGTFTNATIIRKSLDLHLEGQTVEKTGFNTYHIKDGWIITCKLEEDETPPWSFASTDTTITEGGYALLENATFRIKDVPVLYSPWMIVPAKNKRQTGLLFPELSLSERNGFGFDLPLFVNLTDSSDLTLFPQYYANRGFMPGMEFRYVLGESQKGTLMGNFLQDRLSDPSETDYYQDTGFTHTNEDRYWFRGKIDHDLPNNLYTRIDLDVVSDRDYLTEFNTGFTGYNQTNERFLRTYGRNFQAATEDQRFNTMKVLKAWDTMSLQTNLLTVNDVQANNTSPTPLWTTPGLNFTGSLPVADSAFTLDWGAEYVNYWREDGVGGQRLDMFPRLSTPVPLGPYLESRAEVGVRNTSYMVKSYGDGTWDQNETPSRSLFNLHGEVGTTLLRNFSLTGGEIDSWDHRLRPYVEYDYVPKTNQSDLPLFDEADRVENENAITYGINNFFELFGDSKKNSSRDYGFFKVWESYDLRSQYTERPLTPVSFKLGWTPVTSYALSYQTDLGVYGEGLTFYSLESRYSNSRGDALILDYVYSGDELIQGSPFSRTRNFNVNNPFSAYYTGLEAIHQINVTLRTKIINTVSVGYRVQHSLEQSETNEQEISLIYHPACWSVELRSNYTPIDQGVMLLFNLAHIGAPLGVNLGGQ